MNTFKCDWCGRDTDVENKVYVCLPRPSDPTEIVAVMWDCLDCHPNRSGLVGTRSEVFAHFEANMEREGWMWLSI